MTQMRMTDLSRHLVTHRAALATAAQLLNIIAHQKLSLPCDRRKLLQHRRAEPRKKGW
ncbi:hypothetical protein Q669_17935 [Labrenzia sp. C1B10]|nr:hypothetical protein Q669_17935 [Labrenzia sp. C1B10]ERS07168.1 hypothetical protein Q675_23560 [Labrenzia sp. C1B70]